VSVRSVVSVLGLSRMRAVDCTHPSTCTVLPGSREQRSNPDLRPSRSGSNSVAIHSSVYLAPSVLPSRPSLRITRFVDLHTGGVALPLAHLFYLLRCRQGEGKRPVPRTTMGKKKGGGGGGGGGGDGEAPNPEEEKKKRARTRLPSHDPETLTRRSRRRSRRSCSPRSSILSPSRCACGRMGGLTLTIRRTWRRP
jgi:hypothetical protein